jgi:phosphatidylinositol 4-kinase
MHIRQVIQVTVSMLLQRLHGADPVIERAIINNLIPLVSKANDDLVLEVVQAFTAIYRSSNPEDPRTSSNAVLAGLTTLARGLGSRPKACSAFLAEMFSLFIDKGASVQSAWSQSQNSKTHEKASVNVATDTLSELAALLLPIDAVLANPACTPSLNPSPDIVGAFRDMWFLCVVYGFTRNNSSYVNESGQAALRRIASKTPALILEKDKDYVNSGLEYNPVFRRDYTHTVSSSENTDTLNLANTSGAQVLPQQRNSLTELLPKRANEIRNFSMPQATLVQTVHDLELLRTINGRPSVILDYFCNDSLNESPIAGCLEAVADKVGLTLVYALRPTALMMAFYLAHTCLPKRPFRSSFGSRDAANSHGRSSQDDRRYYSSIC